MNVGVSKFAFNDAISYSRPPTRLEQLVERGPLLIAIGSRLVRQVTAAPDTLFRVVGENILHSPRKFAF